MKLYSSDMDIGIKNNLLDEIINCLKLNVKKGKVILFGSRARGDFKKTSDIDLAIKDGEYRKQLLSILDEEMHTLLKFDLVDMSKSNGRINEEIENEGIIILELN